MKKKRFSVEQIIAVPTEPEAGAKTAELCRQHGISQAPCYNWKARYAGMIMPEARRLKELGQENQKLKKLLAEAELDKAALKGSAGRKMVSPQAKREAVAVLMSERHVRFTCACGLVGISRSLYRYQSKRPDTGALRSRISEIAAEKRRYGYRSIHVLLKREGFTVNAKRTYRLYGRRDWQYAAANVNVLASSSANRCRNRPRPM